MGDPRDRSGVGLRWLPWLLVPVIGGIALWMMHEPGRGGAGGEDEAGELLERSVDRPRLVGHGSARSAVRVEDLLKIWRNSSTDEEDAAARARVARLVAENPDLLRRIVEELRGLPTGRWTSQSFLRWRELIWILTWLGPDGARELGGLLASVRPELASDLVGRLRDMGPEAAVAVGAMLAHYQRVPGDPARWLVVEALGAVGADAQAAGPLLHELVKPPVYDGLAGAAARALMAIEGPTSAVLGSLRAALEDEDTEARADVLGALAKAGAAAAPFTDFLLLLLDDTEERVRIEAARVLGAIGIASPATVEALRELLEIETQRGKRTVAQALVNLGPEGQAALVDVCEHGDDVTDRLAAAEAIKGSGGLVPGSARELRWIVEDGEQEKWFRVRALSALIAMPPDVSGSETIELLFRLLEQPLYRANAIYGLAARPEASVWARLRVWASTADAASRFSVGASLRTAKHDIGQGTEMVLEVAESADDVAVARNALQHLLLFEPRPDVDRLLGAVERRLEDGEAVLTYSIVHGLGRLGREGDRVVPLLILALGGQGLWPAATGLPNYPAYASRSVPALLDAYATYGAWVDWRWTPRPLHDALAKLGPKWSGTRAALDAAIAELPEKGKPYLEDLRKKILR